MCDSSQLKKTHVSHGLRHAVNAPRYDSTNDAYIASVLRQDGAGTLFLPEDHRYLLWLLQKEDALFMSVMTNILENIPDSGLDYHDELTGRSLLHNAIVHGRYWQVMALIHFGADMEARDRAGDTPLLLACSSSSAPCTRLLLEASSNIGARDNAGTSALMIAAYYGRLQHIPLLIQANADVNTQDHRGWSPLMFASSRGCDSIVQSLITHNADVDASNDRGQTALILASINGHINVAKALLTAGASPFLLDNACNSALKYAMRYGHRELTTLIISALVTQQLTPGGVLHPLWATRRPNGDSYPLLSCALRGAVAQFLISATAVCCCVCRRGPTLLAGERAIMATCMELLAAYTACAGATGKAGLVGCGNAGANHITMDNSTSATHTAAALALARRYCAWVCSLDSVPGALCTQMRVWTGVDELARRRMGVGMHCGDLERHGDVQGRNHGGGSESGESWGSGGGDGVCVGVVPCDVDKYAFVWIEGGHGDASGVPDHRDHNHHDTAGGNGCDIHNNGGSDGGHNDHSGGSDGADGKVWTDLDVVREKDWNDNENYAMEFANQAEELRKDVEKEVSREMQFFENPQANSHEEFSAVVVIDVESTVEDGDAAKEDAEFLPQDKLDAGCHDAHNASVAVPEVGGDIVVKSEFMGVEGDAGEVSRAVAVAAAPHTQTHAEHLHADDAHITSGAMSPAGGADSKSHVNTTITTTSSLHTSPTAALLPTSATEAIGTVAIDIVPTSTCTNTSDTDSSSNPNPRPSRDDVHVCGALDGSGKGSTDALASVAGTGDVTGSGIRAEAVPVPLTHPTMSSNSGGEGHRKHDGDVSGHIHASAAGSSSLSERGRSGGSGSADGGHSDSDCVVIAFTRGKRALRKSGSAQKRSHHKKQSSKSERNDVLGKTALQSYPSSSNTVSMANNNTVSPSNDTAVASSSARASTGQDRVDHTTGLHTTGAGLFGSSIAPSSSDACGNANRKGRKSMRRDSQTPISEKKRRVEHSDRATAASSPLSSTSSSSSSPSSPSSFSSTTNLYAGMNELDAMLLSLCRARTHAIATPSSSFSTSSSAASYSAAIPASTSAPTSTSASTPTPTPLTERTPSPSTHPLYPFCIPTPLTVSDLLRARADPNCADVVGVTPLIAAADAGNLRAATALLLAGANIDAKSHAGNTPLLATVRTTPPDPFQARQRHAVACLLVSAGASIHVADATRQLPLQLALCHGLHDTATLLLLTEAYQHLAPHLVPRLRNDSSLMTAFADRLLQSCFTVAEAHGHDSRCMRSTCTQWGMQSAVLASWCKHLLSSVKYRGVINPILSAAQAMHAPVVCILLRHKFPADVMLVGGRWTSLMLACTHDDPLLAAMLLVAKAQVNQVNTKKWTPLMIAHSHGHWATVELLLDARADVNARDLQDDTVLTSSIQSHSVRMLESLLAAGGDVNKVGTHPSSLSLLLTAVLARRVDLLHVFLRHGASPDGPIRAPTTPLLEAVRLNSGTMVRMLLRAKADVNRVLHETGASALSVSCAYKYWQVARMLLHAKANVNLRDHEHRTPLLLMCSSDAEADQDSMQRTQENAFFSLLLRSRAAPNATDNHAVTPLMVSSEVGDLTRINALLCVGADVSLRDDMGETALITAIEWDRRDIALLLLLCVVCVEKKEELWRCFTRPVARVGNDVSDRMQTLALSQRAARRTVPSISTHLPSPGSAPAADSAFAAGAAVCDVEEMSADTDGYGDSYGGSDGGNCGDAEEQDDVQERDGDYEANVEADDERGYEEGEEEEVDGAISDDVDDNLFDDDSGGMFAPATSTAQEQEESKYGPEQDYVPMLLSSEAAALLRGMFARAIEIWNITIDDLSESVTDKAEKRSSLNKSHLYAVLRALLSTTGAPSASPRDVLSTICHSITAAPHISTIFPVVANLGHYFHSEQTLKALSSLLSVSYGLAEHTVAQELPKTIISRIAAARRSSSVLHEAIRRDNNTHITALLAAHSVANCNQSHSTGSVLPRANANDATVAAGEMEAARMCDTDTAKSVAGCIVIHKDHADIPALATKLHSALLSACAEGNRWRVLEMLRLFTPPYLSLPIPLHVEEVGEGQDDQGVGTDGSHKFSATLALMREVAVRFAIENGHVDLLKALLVAGIDADAVLPGIQASLLVFAASSCTSSSADVVRLLLQHSASVNACDRYGNTPLMHASSRGDLDVVEVLLQHKTALEMVNIESNATALMVATAEGHDGIVRRLLEANAHAGARCVKKATALMWALEKHHDAIASRLLADGGMTPVEVNYQTVYGTSALMVACNLGKYAFVTSILRAHGQTDVDAVDLQGLSALMLASHAGHEKCVRLLLKAKANSYMMSANQYTAFHYACLRGNTGVLSLLLEMTPDISQFMTYIPDLTRIATEGNYQRILDMLAAYKM